MAFCPHCGYQMAQMLRFCPACGQDLTSYAGTVATPVTNTALNDHRIALVGIGSCRMEPASDILEDMFGYTDSQAKSLIRSAPVEIATGLTATQAQYIAQALTEYGLQVSVYTDRGYVTFNNHLGGSVFDSAGNYVTGLVEALAMFGVANRVVRMDPWRGFGAGGLFSTPWGRPTPPMHHRRPPVRPIPPRPAPVRPAPPRGPAPQPPRGPAPMPGRGPMGGPMGGPGGPMGGPGGHRGPGGNRGPGGPGGRTW